MVRQSRTPHAKLQVAFLDRVIPDAKRTSEPLQQDSNESNALSSSGGLVEYFWALCISCYSCLNLGKKYNDNRIPNVFVSGPMSILDV